MLFYIESEESLEQVLDEVLTPYIKLPRAKLGLDLETTPQFPGVFPRPIKYKDGTYHGRISTCQLGLDPEIDDRQFIIKGNLDLRKLKPVLENTTILGQNLKYDWGFFKEQYDIDFGAEDGIYKKLRDTMLISQIFFAGDKIKHNLSSLYKEFIPFSWFKEATGMTFKEHEEWKERMQKSDWSGVLTDEQLRYAAEDARLPFFLYKAQMEKIDEWRDKFEKNFPAGRGIIEVIKLECSLIPIFATAEIEGIKFDSNYYKQTVIPYLEGKLNEASDEIGKYFSKKVIKNNGRRGRFKKEWEVNEPININSPDQLREALREVVPELSAKSKTKKTPTGRECWQESTGEDELKQYIDRHIGIKYILQYKKASHLLSNFATKLPTLATDRGYIHCSWLQMGDDNNAVDSGRGSSKNPNLTQQPARELLFGEVVAGDLFREGFIVEPDEDLMSLDYSQIELREAGELCNDESLIEELSTGKDVYSLTAKNVLELDYFPTKGDYNRDFIGKTFELSSLFQVGAKKLTKFMFLESNGKVAWQVDDTKLRLERHFNRRCGIKSHMMKVERAVREKPEDFGSLEAFKGRKPFYTSRTVLGRPRRFCITNEQERMAKSNPILLEKYHKVYNEETDSFSSWNEFARRLSAASREAFNTEIQGTAADLLKFAELFVYRRIKELGLRAKIIGFIHDELLIKSHKLDSARVFEVAKEEMIRAGELFLKRIPCVVNGKIASNWANAK